jgi:hypothetical protein
MSPYEARYLIKPSIYLLHVWGCVIYVKVPSLKKSEDQVIHGYFMGVMNSCLLTSLEDHIAPDSFLLISDPPSILPLTEVNINISDYLSFDSYIFELHNTLPPNGTPLECTFINNLLYLHQYQPDSSLATTLSKYGFTTQRFLFNQIYLSYKPATTFSHPHHCPYRLQGYHPPNLPYSPRSHWTTLQ